MWVVYADYIEDWFLSLDSASKTQVVAAIEVLKTEGPALGRPLVDSISHSTIRNMKELRPGSSGRSELRILFVFDPQRQAVLLVAGDKAKSWSRWYKKNIPLAEKLYRQHLEALNTEN